MKRLDKLYHRRTQIQELVKTAKRFGGYISLDDAMISINELNQWLSEVNAEIAVIISNSKLRIHK